ncbi:Zn2/Cys6 DNA-binding protein [Pleurostoma richardsiae]|uniref:Zn2/Cys6 DNA-binding protein n=1 Tax=Pleurostoma richardsiae TaxID=41990 RepID=A0AA38VHR3_9PEZI|nr:Zn2/Cys6 DNA-binding protein [Pleurostoma richardsiae]
MTNALRQHSCALCRQRKVRCDKQGQEACSYCVKHALRCLPASPPLARPRKKRFPEAELLSRLRKYEAALRTYGADLDAIVDGEDPGVKRVPDNEAKAAGSSRKAESSAGTESVSEKGGPSMNTVDEEADDVPRERLLKDEDDEIEVNPMLSAYDDTFYIDDSTNVLTLLAQPFSSADLPGLHPEPVQIFNLWQIFLDNVHPLLRIFHAPSLQKQLLNIASDPPSASPGLHALLLAVYANAITSMKEEACLTIMNESRSTLISRYVAGAWCALLRAGFVGSTDLTVLQAFVLYLYSIIRRVHPRSLVCLTGLADRIARTRGLHRSTQGRDTSAFKAEMRRRVWWQIIILDSRAAELSANGTSILGSAWNTALPLNTNEGDLAPDADKLPEGRQAGATDMIFCLVRCEVADFLRQLRARRGAAVKWSEFSSVSVPLESKLATIREFDQHLSAKYLSHCDPCIPLHALTQYYAMYAVSKMKIVAYRTPPPPDQPLDNAAVAERQEGLMGVCIEVIEAYNRCAADRLLRHFAWFSVSCFPFLAFGHLFFCLRTRTEGELVGRAWDVLAACGDGPVDGSGPHWLSALRPIPFEVGNPAVQSALAGLAVAAWEAREAALQEAKMQALTPKLVIQMRELLQRSNAQHAISVPGFAANTSSVPIDVGLRPGPQQLESERLDGGAATEYAMDMPMPVADQVEEEPWENWMPYETAWEQIDWGKPFPF